MPLWFAVILSFQRLLGSLLEGAGGGGLEKNDHEFPFLRIVKLFECSLTYVIIPNSFAGCFVMYTFRVFYSDFKEPCHFRIS